MNTHTHEQMVRTSNNNDDSDNADTSKNSDNCNNLVLSKSILDYILTNDHDYQQFNTTCTVLNQRDVGSDHFVVAMHSTMNKKIKTTIPTIMAN